MVVDAVLGNEFDLFRAYISVTYISIALGKTCLDSTDLRP